MIEDIFQQIREDHLRISQLFEGAKAASLDSREQWRHYRVIRGELQVHGAAEEQILYPFLKREKDTALLAEEAMRAHDEFDSLMEELDVAPPAGDAWRMRFARLRSAFERHVVLEEGEIFPYMHRIFAQAEIKNLAIRFDEAREKARGQLVA